MAGNCCGHGPVLSVQEGDNLRKRVLFGDGLDRVNISNGEHLQNACGRMLHTLAHVAGLQEAQADIHDTHA
jgi:hypothetical protein